MPHEPTIQELIRSVRSWLKDEVMPKLEGYDQFRGRVALGALGVVDRELELRAALDRETRERLQALLEREGTLEELEAELCTRIRSGQLGLADADLMRLLRDTTMGRLAIDQPKYPSYLAALAREKG